MLGWPEFDKNSLFWDAANADWIKVKILNFSLVPFSEVLYFRRSLDDNNNCGWVTTTKLMTSKEIIESKIWWEI